MFKYYLNNVQINDIPDKWDSIDTSVKRDDVSGILLYDSNLRFTTYGGQDLYAALKNKWDTDRYGESTFDVYQRSGQAGYVLIHAGTIFHSDIEFTLINGAINFRTEDRGFYAMINNNKSIEVNLNQNQSKNQVYIGVCPSFNLDMHKVSDGTIYPDAREAYKLYDVIEYMIKFMSDDRIGFESDTFGVGGIYEGYCMVAGHEMIEADGTISPRTSWAKLVDNLVKRFNVRFAMVGTLEQPVLKCESYEQFYSGSISYTIPTIPDEVVMKVDTSAIYSGVNVGSEDYESTSTLTFPDVQYLISFKEENFYFKGTNNIDRTLDLVGSYVISNSSIEVVLEQLSGYENYDEKQFIIHYDTATDQTIATNWSAVPNVYLYNETLNNINILSRWASAFPNEVISNFFNTNTARFLAVNTVWLGYRYFTDQYIGSQGGTLDWGVIRFDNDYSYGYDNGSNYGDTTPQGTTVSQSASFYTAPVGGLYNFAALVKVSHSYFSGGTTLIGYRWHEYYIKIINSTTGQEFTSSAHRTPASYGFEDFDLSVSCTSYLNAGETMEVRLYVRIESAGSYSNNRRVSWAINPNSYFTSNGVDIGGGTLTPANPEQFKAVKVAFTYPVTLADYFTIRQSKEGLIKVPISSTKAINGWVENLKFDHSSGEASFNLISDGSTIYR